MTYAVFDTDTNQFVQGPWRELPGRVKWTPGDTVSPPKVGLTYGLLIIVEVVDTDTPPSEWHTETGKSYALEGSTLTVSRTFAQTKSPTAQHIKKEANRRIVAAYPEWKQRNMTARAVELVNKKVSGAALTADEQAEEAAIQAVLNWIRAIRTRSDELEVSLPLDYGDDGHWTV